MKVFVTGAAGFIGSELVRVLVARGHRVTALVHRTAHASMFGPEVEAVVGDVTVRASFEAADKDPDAIAHLALLDERAGQKIPEMYSVWMKGTSSLLTVASRRCSGTLRRTSSRAAIGRKPIGNT